MYVAKAAVAAHFRQIRLNHFTHQFIECHFMPPAEPLASLARIAEQGVGFRRPKVARVDLDEHAAVAFIDTVLGQSRTAPFYGSADTGKGFFGKFANRMLFAGRQHRNRPVWAAGR